MRSLRRSGPDRALRRLRSLWFVLVALGCLARLATGQGDGTGAPAAPRTRFESLPPLPDPIGFAGAFVGVSGGALVFAGGANFAPPVWENDKRWSDRVFVLASPDAGWREVDSLPAPRGYGASVAHGDGVICIGGDDADAVHRDVWRLSYTSGRVTLETLPSLPMPLAYCAAAVVGDRVVVVGGQTSKDLATATDRVLGLDLGAPGAAWTELEPLPGGPRVLAFAVAQHDGSAFGVHVFGGRRAEAEGPFGLAFLQDHWRLDPATGAWVERSPPPRPLMAGCAAATGQAHVAVLGYADGSILTEMADSGSSERDFDHPGFPRELLAYHTITDRWSSLGALPDGVQNQVTTSAVAWRGGIVVPSGEVAPRVRTPAVHLVHLEPHPARFGALDLGVLVLYLLAMVGVGAWFTRGNRSTDDYFRGGQRLPFWAVGCSIYATMLSSLTYVGMPALVFATDWLLYPGVLMILAVAPIAIRIAMPFFRRIDATSAYEYFGLRFGPGARLFGSGLFTIFHVSRMGIVMALTALALSAVVGVDAWVSVLVMGVLCIAYSTLGGIRAVIWTDTIQTVVLLGGVLLCLAVIATGLDGDWAELSATAAAAGKTRLVDVSFDAGSATRLAIWVVILGGLGQNLSSYTADQAVVQRYVTTHDARDASRAIWMNGIMAVPGSLLFFLLGTGLWLFYRGHPERLDPTVQNDQVFPMFIGSELPTGIAGLLVAGIFAAAQSTVSTSMNSTATTVVTDFLRPAGLVDDGARSLAVARVTTVVMGVLGTCAGLSFISPDIRSLLAEYFKVIGMLMGALGGLFLLGVTSERAHGRGAMLGLIAGFGTMVVVWQTTAVDGYLYAAIGIVVTVVVGLVASRVLPDPGTGRAAGLTLGTLGPERGCETRSGG